MCVQDAWRVGIKAGESEAMADDRENAEHGLGEGPSTPLESPHNLLQGGASSSSFFPLPEDPSSSEEMLTTKTCPPADVPAYGKPGAEFFPPLSDASDPLERRQTPLGGVSPGTLHGVEDPELSQPEGEAGSPFPGLRVEADQTGRARSEQKIGADFLKIPQRSGRIGIPDGETEDFFLQTSSFASDDLLVPDDATPIATRQELRKKEPPSFFKELPFLLLLGFGIVVLLRSFILQPFFIPSGSMQMTLDCDDRVLVNRLAYLYQDVQRRDVIVFRDWEVVGRDVPTPSIWKFVTTSLREGVGIGRSKRPDLIKRVVAIPGDTFLVRDSKVYLRGPDGKDVLQEEPYIFVDGDDRYADFGPVTVPEGKVFAMGDHRNNSEDSRRDPDGQFVDVDAIVGKTFLRFWPPSRFGGLQGPKDGAFEMSCPPGQ